MTITTSTEYTCTGCNTAGRVTTCIHAADPWESANLCGACLRARLSAVEVAEAETVIAEVVEPFIGRRYDSDFILKLYGAMRAAEARLGPGWTSGALSDTDDDNGALTLDAIFRGPRGETVSRRVFTGKGR